MKRFILTAICVITALTLLSLVSCTKKTTVSPTGATATSIPAPTATNTPVPLEVSDFEGPGTTNTDGWSVIQGFFNISSTGTTTDSDLPCNCPTINAYKNLSMAELPFAMYTAGGSAICTVEKTESTPYPSFQGRSIIAHVWIPASLTDTADTYQLQIFFTGGTAPNTYNQTPVNLSTATGYAWNTFTYTLPATPAQEYTDESSVQVYGINLLQNGAPAIPNGDILFLDDVVVQ